jgi:hypothetical protein
MRDQAVTPAADWRIDDLNVGVEGLSTAEGATPGRLTLAAS